MDIQTLIQVLGLLGIGGIIGSYIQHLWKLKGETELKIQSLNEVKYRSILVFMRCVLKPENVKQFIIEDPQIQNLKDIESIRIYAKEKITEHYYNSILYSSDNVLRMLKQFMENPTEANFIGTAIEMRKDLWKRRTKISTSDLLK